MTQRKREVMQTLAPRPPPPNHPVYLKTPEADYIVLCLEIKRLGTYVLSRLEQLLKQEAFAAT